MIQITKDEFYMRRCLELARKGLGLTRQNPLVGSVIVHNDIIIGEGYHHEYGGPHAEVNALNSVTDKSLLPESTLYVNLEPCSHQGKTPPCSILLREKKIPRIVIGSIDTNPNVSGKGITILEEGGAEVVSGVLNEECRELNRRFFVFHEQKRPYVILKWARTEDGFIDKVRTGNQPNKPNWITNHTARMLVHKWRSETISIMAGTDTILTDNPALNVREWPGIDPIRVIPDRNNRLSEDLNVMDGKSPTHIFSVENKIGSYNTSYINISPENFTIESFLNEMNQRQITSVFVEGGAKLLQSFIDSGLWDESFVFFGNQTFGSGVKAPVLNCEPYKKVEIRGSNLYIYKNFYKCPI